MTASEYDADPVTGPVPPRPADVGHAWHLSIVDGELEGHRLLQSLPESGRVADRRCRSFACPPRFTIPGTLFEILHTLLASNPASRTECGRTRREARIE